MRFSRAAIPMSFRIFESHWSHTSVRRSAKNMNMNKYKYPLTSFIACLLVLSGCSNDPGLDFSGGATTPESLAEQLIEAVNERNSATQRSIIHPLSFANLSAVQEQFLHETLDRDFQRGPVPEKRTLSVEELEGEGLPFDDEVNWPIEPTHSVTIQYDTGEFSSTAIVEFIVKDHDRWWIVAPMIKAEFLSEFDEANSPSPQ